MNPIIKNIFSLFCFLSFLSMTTTVLAQNAMIDSLKNELSMHQQKDKARVDLLNTIAFENYGLDQDQLKQYADEANALAKEISFIKGEARSLYLQSLYHLGKGDLENASSTIDQSFSLETEIDNPLGVSDCYDIMGTISVFQADFAKSISYYDKALKIAKEENDQKRVAKLIKNIGSVHSRKGDFDQAIVIYKKSIALYDSLNLDEEALKPLSNLALTYARQGRNVEALAYFQKCLSGFREYGNKIFGASTLLNLGLVYLNINEHDKALPYVLEALEINKALGNEIEVSKSIMNLGIIYHAKKEYDKALEYYNEALTFSIKTDNKVGKYRCYANIAAVHFDHNEYELALNNYKKCLDLSLELGRKREIANSYFFLGTTYFELKDFDKSLENTLKGKELADEISLLQVQERASSLLSMLYEKKNNYKEALESLKEHKTYSDSVLNAKNIQKIAELEYSYKYKQELDAANDRELKLNQTIQATSRDLEKSQRNFLLGVIAFLLLTLVLGAIIFSLKLRHAKSEAQNVVMEQKLLRSQMTPHFIFNSLSVLQGMILNKEDKKSILYLSKFSKLLRITLENSRDKLVPLYQELTAIENYLELQNLEVNQSYQYTISVDDKINTSSFEIPPMLIQPFIENAIEHGFKDQKADKKIDVQLKYLNKELICTITDNGIGINAQKQAQKENKKSLATAITSERLEMLSKDFKIKSALSIEDRQKYNERGTIVTLVIPYIILEA